MSVDGDADAAVEARIRIGWNKFRQKTWKEVVREDCQARKLNKEDAMDRCKWRKMIKEAR